MSFLTNPGANPNLNNPGVNDQGEVFNTGSSTGGIVDAVTGTNDASDDPVFSPGSDNTDFFDQAVTDPTAIIDNVGEQILRELILAGQAQGFSPYSMTQFWEGLWTSNGALGFMDGLFKAEDENASYFANAVRKGWIPEEELTDRQRLGAQWFVQTVDGFNYMVAKVWDFYNQRAPIDLGDLGHTVKAPSRGRSGSGLTEAQIRNKFDLDELAEAAKDIWRGLLLTDDFDSRAQARAYVDAMVAGKGEKKIDFREFIRSKAKETARYASIYADKPESLSEEQFLAPYHQAALRVLSPDDAAAVAIGGAQFGADAQTFAARLRRSEAAQSSAPFINELQGRLEDLNKVFRGS